MYSHSHSHTCELTHGKRVYQNLVDTDSNDLDPADPNPVDPNSVDSDPVDTDPVDTDSVDTDVDETEHLVGGNFMKILFEKF